MIKQNIVPYSNSKVETIIDESDIDYAFDSIYIAIISNIQKSLGKCLGLIFDLVIDVTINFSKYKRFAGSSCIRFSKGLDHPK